MMKNRFAGDILEKMKRLADGGITMNCQIVCCKGLNDGEELKRSMRDLAELYPHVASVSIVPAGITCHRNGLYPLEPFTPEECGVVIDIVDEFANKCLEKSHRHQYVFFDYIAKIESFYFYTQKKPSFFGTPANSGGGI